MWFSFDNRGANKDKLRHNNRRYVKCLNCLFFNHGSRRRYSLGQSRQGHICRNLEVNPIRIPVIAQTTLAGESFLYPASLHLTLALVARDNLESFLSYVEEVEGNHMWRLQICERELYCCFSFSPPCLTVSPAVTGGQKERSRQEESDVRLVRGEREK